jgi:arginine decarboxylase
VRHRRLRRHAVQGPAGDEYDIQLNKTSRNSVLLQSNINNTRSDVAHLIKVLAEIAREIDAARAGRRDARRRSRRGSS